MLVINTRFSISYQINISKRPHEKNIKINFPNPRHFRFTLEEFPNYPLSCYYCHVKIIYCHVFILLVFFYFSVKH